LALFDGALGALSSGMPGLPDPTALLAGFAQAFQQNARLLKLHFASGAGIPEQTLLPHRLTGWESINDGFRYELECLAASVDLELKQFLGVPAQIEILTDAGAPRVIAGLVTSVGQEGSDGGFSRYRLVLESALAPLSLRRTHRVFLNLSVLDIFQQVIQEHLDGNPVLAASLDLDNRCLGTYAPRDFVFQCGESDTAFLRRILAREGISFVFVPAADGSTDLPKMNLTLFDDPKDLDPSEAASVRFHRADGTEASDAITRWEGCRVLQPGAVARNAWDPGAAAVNTSSEPSQNEQGDYGQALAATLEDYHYHPGLAADPQAISTPARQAMQAREGWAKRFEGSGTVRAFRAGTWFTLQDHPGHDGDAPQDRDFVLLRVELAAQNNLPSGLAAALLASATQPQGNGGPQPPFTCNFTCVRRGIPIQAEELAPPRPGLLTAVAVGPDGEEVHTDAMGRIKVQFPFARAAEHPQAGASGTDKDSAWIRLAQPWGSAGFGASFVPRVGDEVLVDFLGNDPDQPLIVGRVHNGLRRPASFSDASSLPGDKALSGFRSQMLQGSGGNELVFDDTTDALRARLASDHARSELNLGAITGPRSGGSAEPRGQGFELHSAAYGALRAEQGLLLSTEPGQASLDAPGLTAQVSSGQSLSQSLSAASQGHQAAPFGTLEAGAALQKSLAATVQMKGRAIPAFADPILALSSPAGIVSGTPQDQRLSAGQGLHLDSGGDTGFAVGRRLIMAVKEALSVFVAQSGIKLFAGKGRIDIQAHQGRVGISAAQDLQVVSTEAGLEILAKTGLRVSAAGAELLLQGGNVRISASGTVTIKAGAVEVNGGSQSDALLPELPKSSSATGFSARAVVANHVTGQPLARVPYEVTALEDGSLITSGQTDDQGRTERWHSGDAPKACVVWIGDGDWTVSHEHEYASVASEQDAWPLADPDPDSDPES